MTNHFKSSLYELEPPSPVDLDFALGYSEDHPERLAMIGLAALALETSETVSDEDSVQYSEIWHDALAMMPDTKPRQQGKNDV